MAERPILFSAPMVRALLAGRKTMTRRLVTNRAAARIEVGDVLWVKETWRPRVAHSCGADTCDCGDVTVRYAADGEERLFLADVIPSPWTKPQAAKRGNVSPLFMPRWASRISLLVTGKRVERAHDITRADAIAEGIPEYGVYLDFPEMLGDPPHGEEERAAFGALWCQINGPESWDANPEVFAFTFERAAAPAREGGR